MIARIQIYNQSIGVHCEICSWTPPPVYDPATMDYQCFALFPMIMPGAVCFRNVVLCRDCYDVAENAAPSMTNPEDQLDDFAAFDYTEDPPELLQHDARLTPVFSALLAAINAASNSVDPAEVDVK